MKKLTYKFKSKPTYEFYIQLWYTLDVYLMTRIDDYIFFKYYDWNVSLKAIQIQEFIDLSILKLIYEYDYKVFKTLLYLYWDLEYYLEGLDYVNNSLIVDAKDPVFLKIKFEHNIKSFTVFLEQIKNKKPASLWENLENRGMFDEMLKYDVYSKIDSLDTKHKNHSKITAYKLYKKYNDLIDNENIDHIRHFQANKAIIEPLYYSNYIEMWYKEWFLELNQDSSLKHWSKTKELQYEFNNLIEIFK